MVEGGSKELIRELEECRERVEDLQMNLEDCITGHIMLDFEDESKEELHEELSICQEENRELVSKLINVRNLLYDLERHFNELPIEDEDEFEIWKRSVEVLFKRIYEELI